jgi:hypothetical protein
VALALPFAVRCVLYGRQCRRTLRWTRSLQTNPETLALHAATLFPPMPTFTVY